MTSPATIVADAATAPEIKDERSKQKDYWAAHSDTTVEAMMLDSKASEIDKLERPEVRGGIAGLEITRGIARKKQQAFAPPTRSEGLVARLAPANETRTTSPRWRAREA